MTDTRLAQEENRLLACVHCGFCLSACPTYTRLGNEADSPRGRLVLMRAVVEGRLEPDADPFAVHIDQCLGCRACEPVCPSGVQYGFLVERARATAVDARGQKLLTRLLLGTFGSRWTSALAGIGGRILRSGGLAAAIARMIPSSFGGARLGLAMLGATRPASQHMHALDGGLPEGTSITTGLAAMPAKRRPRVALLQGCVQHALYHHVNVATREVLEAAGCEIITVNDQKCCGALHAHSGELDHALDLARANIDAFLEADPDVIVVNAAGCGAMMKEYGEQLENDPLYAARAHELAARVRDISEYLVEIDFRPRGAVPLRVTYDAPCHLHHAQRITHAPLDLLARIPSLELIPLHRADECCGGAGIYGITHPDLGGRILNDKVDAVLATKAQIVLTPNPGCMMQIGAGLILRGEDIPAMHPIEIIARSVRAANRPPTP